MIVVIFLCRFICRLTVSEEERLFFSNIILIFFDNCCRSIFNKWVSQICNKNLCTAWNTIFKSI